VSLSLARQNGGREKNKVIRAALHKTQAPLLETRKNSTPKKVIRTHSKAFEFEENKNTKMKPKKKLVFQ
jgi:hypothetical protein